MNLLDNILENLPYDTITDTELVTLVAGTKASRHNQLKRAVASGKLIHIRRGLYHLAKRYQRRPLNSFELAQKIYGPSYISFESALSYHGLIPEAVYSVTSACLNRSHQFETPLGIYSYSQIPRRVFFLDVDRIESEKSVYLIATPLKALADTIFHSHQDWRSAQELLESLRIESNDLNFKHSEIDFLANEYKTKRVTQILSELKRILPNER